MDSCVPLCLRGVQRRAAVWRGGGGGSFSKRRATQSSGPVWENISRQSPETLRDPGPLVPAEGRAHKSPKGGGHTKAGSWLGAW